MPVINNPVLFKTGTKAAYDQATINESYLYFTSDTHQLFVGSNEFTKSYGGDLSGEPTTATTGEIGKIYSYNGSVYACKAYDGTDYTWERIANINDYIGTVTSVAAGDGLSGDTITSSGSLAHAIPTDAAVTNTGVSENQTPAIGGAFTVQGFTTDKFGHATNVSTYSVTLPGLSQASDSATLASASTFAAVSGVVSTTVNGNNVLQATTTTYTLPISTYSFTSTQEGKITVSPSGGTAYDVTINGWSDLAKKSELAAVFTYKGSVAEYSDLSNVSNPKVGDVWHVEETNSEYVYVEDPDNQGQYIWEELGSAVDLSDYAKTADVIARLGAASTAGHLPTITADGQLADSGVTPADLATTVASNPSTASTVYIVGSGSSSASTSSLEKSSGIYMDLDNNTITASTFSGDATMAKKLDHDVAISIDGGVTGSMTAADFSGSTYAITVTSVASTAVSGTLANDTTGNAQTASTASMAINDGLGNRIDETYVTQSQLQNALVWQAI